VLSSASFNDKCTGSKICVLAVMPNIYDSSAKERSKYLDTLMIVAKSQRKQPLEFFWTQSGDHLDVERQLNLGFGYPAVVAISPAKNVFATMRGSYSVSGTKDFITKVLSGGMSVDKMPALSWKKADKWDGKDAPVLEEDASDEL